MGFVEKLTDIKSNVDEVVRLVQAGNALSPDEVQILERLQRSVRTMRDESIRSDSSPGREIAARYGITQARVSQIRAEGRTRVPRSVSKKDALNVNNTTLYPNEA